MGAVGGHMLHPYENLDLGFDQMRDIFQIASKGFPNIKITEKTDGQNISISYDHRTGQALAIRNNAHANEGGLDKETLKSYFTTDRIAAGKNPTPINVVNAFYAAMINFEKIAHLLSPEFFYTPSGERLFYNAEVMDPESENVIPYDTQVLLIHRVGHKKLVDGKLISLSEDQADYRGAKKLAEERSAALEARLQELQIDSPDVPTTKVNAIVDFTEFIEKKEAYHNAVNELRTIQGSAKTVGEYLENRLKFLLQEKLGSGYSEETYDRLMLALMHFATTGMPRKTIEIKSVLESIPGEEAKDFINEFLRTRSAMKDIKDRAMNPLIMVNHRFATRVLEGFISGYTLQAEDSLSRLRTKVGEKAKDSKVLADEGSLTLLKTSLAKIHGGEDVGDVLSDEAVQSALEKITTVIEGLVFDYEGETYKFTGQFAPVNQMLGLGKYDRTPKKEGLEEALEDEPIVEPRFGEGRVIVLVPGAFKPPHIGHFEMVRHYSDLVGSDGYVYVLISPLPRGVGRDNEAEVTFDDSRKIWNIYIDSSALNNVIIYDKPSESNSPIGQVVEFIENKNDELDFAQPGDEIILGCSNKPDKKGKPDFERFGNPGTFQKYAREGVIISDHVAGCFQTSEGAISATDFREALLGKDISSYIPPEVDPEWIKSIFSIKPIQEEKKTISLLYSLVERVLDEERKKTKVSKTGQKRVSKKIAHLIDDEGKSKEQAAAIAYSMEEEGDLDEVSAMAAGAVEGSVGPGPRKKKKKQDTLIREVLNYLVRSSIMETQQ